MCDEHTGIQTETGRHKSIAIPPRVIETANKPEVIESGAALAERAALGSISRYSVKRMTKMLYTLL